MEGEVWWDEVGRVMSKGSSPDVVGGALAFDLQESGTLIAIATVVLPRPP